MISARYAPALALLLLIALVPTVIHTYAGLEADDGRSTAAIPDRLAGFTGVATERRPAWGEAVFAAHDWFERSYTQGATKVRLFVGRSFNQKRLYHHPEIGLSRGVDLEPEQVVRPTSHPDWPVHLRYRQDRQGLIAYLLYYDGRFIEDPVANQLREAVPQLFAPRRPMTLFYVAQEGLPPNAPLEQTAAFEVLRAAVEQFLAQGGQGSR